MTATETMALILAVLVFFKIIVTAINPGARIKIAKKLYGSKNTTIIISLILSAVVLYYLLQELTIVQIFAVFLLLSLLMVLGFAPIANQMIKVLEKELKSKDVIRRNLLSIIIWVLLALWVLLELYK